MKKLLINSLLTKAIVNQKSKDHSVNLFLINEEMIKFCLHKSKEQLEKGIARFWLLTEENVKITLKIVDSEIEKVPSVLNKQSDKSNKTDKTGNNEKLNFRTIYTADLTKLQENIEEKKKVIIQSIIDAIIFENLHISIKSVFAKFLKIKEDELKIKKPTIINNDTINIDKAVIIKVKGGIEGCCIIDIKKTLANTLPDLMGLKGVSDPDDEIVQASMLEFSNIIIGNMSRYLSENHRIHITPTPPAFVQNRKIVKDVLRLIATTVQIKIRNYYEKYNIYILRNQ